MGTAVSWLPDSHTDVVHVSWPQLWNSDTDTTEQQGYDVIILYVHVYLLQWRHCVHNLIYLLSGCQAPKSHYLLHPTTYRLLSLLKKHIKGQKGQLHGYNSHNCGKGWWNEAIFFTWMPAFVSTCLKSARRGGLTKTLRWPISCIEENQQVKT